MGNKNNIQIISNKFRNYIPFAALFVLTAGLLFYFKENKQSVNDLIETGKDNLIGFYTQNLKPLLFKTDITNEDVFNFALYQNLPVDKDENKVLQINYDENSGSQTYEIKPAEINKNTQNYKKFAEYLKLDQTSQSALDSILNSYKGELSTSVLYNDKNTFAVNSKVSLLRDAILADLMAFAQNKNINDTGEPISFNYKYNTADIRDAINEIKLAKEQDINDFIIFTPDSVFQMECEIDKEKFNKDMAALHWDWEKVRNELKDMKLDIKINKIPHTEFDKEFEENYEINIDSNYYKAVIPKDFMVKGMKDLAEVENLTSNIKKLTSQIHKINVQVNNNKLKIKLNNPNVPGTDNELLFDFNLDGLDKLIQNSIPEFDKNDFKEWEEFGFKMDSLANSYQFHINDSTMKFDKTKFKEEMKKVKNELRKVQSKK